MGFRAIKFLSFAFCQFRALFKAMSADGFDEFKAFVVVSALQVWLLIAVVGFLSIGFDRNLIAIFGGSGLLFASVVGTGVFVPNYFLLVRRKSWMQFEAEFEAYSISKRALGWLAMLAVMVFAIGGGFVAAVSVRGLPRW